MLLNTKDRKKKGELRRSRFEGFRARLGFSRKLTTIELRINQVQVRVSYQPGKSWREFNLVGIQFGGIGLNQHEQKYWQNLI